METQILTKELLYELYVKKRMSAEEIVNTYFSGVVSRRTILNYLTKYGIKARNQNIDELEFYE